MTQQIYLTVYGIVFPADGTWDSGYDAVVDLLNAESEDRRRGDSWLLIMRSLADSMETEMTRTPLSPFDALVMLTSEGRCF